MKFRLAPPDLLIAGASGRAAAASAVRAGLRVAVADLFADADAAAIADVTAIADWPAGIEAWADRFDPAVPLLYAGGLENEPGLLARLAARRPLAGVVGEPLAAVRTPERLREVWLAAGVPYPELAAVPDGSRRWLAKPRRSGGGRGVRFARPDEIPCSADCYLQAFVEGTPGSASFLAGPDGVEPLGVAAALLPSRPSLAERFPFAYCGSVTDDAGDAAELRRLGEAVAGIGVRGLFGVDFVRTVEGTLVPIEVNPRYAAGMEVLELRSGRSFVAEHLAAFGFGTGRRRFRPASEAVFGKGIVYADRPLLAGELPTPGPAAIRAGVFAVADVPRPGTSVAACDPVCTVFAVAATAEECRVRLAVAERESLAACSNAVTSPS